MKFDTSTIDGFENMSDADKVTALLGVDLPDPVDTKNLVKKEDFDKVMSEASSYKKQLKEKMTAEETAAAEAKAAQEKLQNDYNALLKENTILKTLPSILRLATMKNLPKVRQKPFLMATWKRCLPMLQRQIRRLQTS